MAARGWAWVVGLALLAGAGCGGGGRPAGAGRSPGPAAALRGDPDWAITRAGAPEEIQGYADRAGVRPGVPVGLMVSTTAPTFRVRAYRFGAYPDGAPAAVVWESGTVHGRRQAVPAADSRGTVVAGWQPSLTLATAGWPPGAYLLRLEASSGGMRWVPLTVESPTAAGRVVLVQPVTSYQAYNTWGGKNLYFGADGTFATRARAVGFDRPYQDEDGAGDFFRLEEPLVLFAERAGTPLAYRTGLDLDQDPHALDGAAAVVSEGHDEYWSPAMRATLTAARDAGSNLAFLGANAVYRKIRFESAGRVEVNYKLPKEDPLLGRDDAAVTGDWPSPPAADPESSLTGQAYSCDSRTDAPLVVDDAAHWLWAGTGVRDGQQLAGLVGPESDRVDGSGHAPPVTVLGHAEVACAAGPPRTANATMYEAAGGAVVFDAGTGNWICALGPDGCPDVPAEVRRVVRTATGNLLRELRRRGARA